MVINPQDKPNRDSERRRRAEEFLQGQETDMGDLSTDDTQALLHELQVHQIELEMQNDELRRVQFEIETMRDQYTDLYDFAPVGYLTVEKSGLISQANLTSALLLGRERSQLIKKPFSRFVFREDQDMYYLHFKQTIETQVPQACDIRLVKKDGAHFYAHLDGVPVVDSEGSVSQCRVALSDITERKQADAVRQENELLRAALEKEKEFSALRDQMMLTIAHEFRTPLAIILTSSEILERYRDDLSEQKRTEKLGSISSQVRHLAGMLDSLTFVVRAKRAYIKYHCTRVDLVELCTQIIAEMEGMALPEHHLIFTNADHSDGSYLDRDLLSRVLVNLISNAIKYSPAGGTIELHLSGDAEELIFRISDEGMGIPQNARHRLFEPFFRAANVETIGGIGLGLTVVEEAVNLLGGSIECTSILGLGTTFTVVIPVRSDRGAGDDG